MFHYMMVRITCFKIISCDYINQTCNTSMQILYSFLTSSELCSASILLPQVIPVKFAKKIRGKVERNIKLESLGGYTFDVQVAQNLGRIMFQSGWKSFVSAHDLKMFDLLVFKYDGMSRMKVLVFDPSGCEKVPPFFVTKNAMSGGRKREEPLDISSSYADLPMKTPETKKKARKQRDRSRINISPCRSISNSSG